MIEAQHEVDVSFAPAPVDGSKWDAVFLFDQPQFEDLFAWFWSVFVCDDGELHQEWVDHQRRTNAGPH